ncbi:hypothetical protein NESM_000346900 [Novymonas esmeraldas]|uniref:Uncharacterized protein n=1 Tax=Novymonas esmeraldas TaxID=1808958 RepID=A0AAW0EL05_9TRYP
MLKLSRAVCSSRYTPVVGCAFLIETLYGSKYSANLGSYSMPYVYVKTILLCATGHGLELRKGRYIHGLIELLLPSKVSQDNLTKLELLQFVDAIPMDHNTGDGDEDDYAMGGEATAAPLSHRISSGGAGVAAATTYEHTDRSISASSSQPDEHRAVAAALRALDDARHAAAAAHGDARDESLASRGDAADAVRAAAAARRRGEEAEEDAAAVESIMSFVSAAAFPSPIARVLVYDAVCTCVADGLYSAKEKERVALVSSHIGLSSAVRSQIEKLALQETVISMRKRRLLLLHAAHTPSTVPLAEERHWQASSALGSVVRRRQREERGSRSSTGVGRHSDPARHRDAEENADALAAEEATRVEAAKALLRRARAHLSSTRDGGARRGR